MLYADDTSLSNTLKTKLRSIKVFIKCVKVISLQYNLITDFFAEFWNSYTKFSVKVLTINEEIEGVNKEYY